MATYVYVGLQIITLKIHFPKFLLLSQVSLPKA